MYSEMVKFKLPSCFKGFQIKLAGVLTDFFQGHRDESVGETGIVPELTETAGAVGFSHSTPAELPTLLLSLSPQ